MCGIIHIKYIGSKVSDRALGYGAGLENKVEQYLDQLLDLDPSTNKPKIWKVYSRRQQKGIGRISYADLANWLGSSS